MSLLDDVSIVVTPNGYKAGTLYGVLPTAVEGSEEVTNGNFSNGSTDWTLGDGFTVSNNELVCDGSQTANSFVTQAVGFVAGRTYRLNYKVSNLTAGQVRINMASTNGTWVSANGDYTFDIVAIAGTLFQIQANNDLAATIDNISVKEWTASDMDVTRATAATRVDENGLLNYAEVLGSEEVTNGDFSNDSDWTKGTGTTISSGVANITAGSSGGSALSQSGGIFVSGKKFKITFTISNYSSGSIAVSNVSPTTYRSGNGTYTLYATGAGGDFLLFSSGFVGSVGNISVKEADRNNVPRIDYTGGGCPKILVEPQRTNLFTYSEDFSQSSWTKNASTITTNAVTSPDGTQNADNLLDTTANNFHGLYKYYDSNANDVITTFIFVKYNNKRYMSFLTNNNASSDRYAYFDLVNKTTHNLSTGITASIETYDNNWLKLSVTSTSAGNNAYYWWNIALSNSATGYVGDGTGSVYIWGAQLEKGSYATSYIPTSGSSVTRNADVFTRDGISSLIGQTEGTIFVDFDYTPHSLNYESVVSLQGTATTQYLECYFNSLNKIFVGVYNGGAVQLSFTSATQTAGNKKIAIAYKANDFAIYLNGTQVHTDNSGSVPLLSKLGLGSDFASSLYQLSQPIKQLQVYKTRLTNTQLAALTS